MTNIEAICSCKALIGQDLRNQMDLNDDEINLILGYVEGHAYKLYWGNQGRWILVNTEKPENEPEELYDIGELIERVNEWNYEFLLDEAVTGEWREKVKRDADIIAGFWEQLGEWRGYGIGTPTVKELIAILSKLPEDYRVTCCGADNFLYLFPQSKAITIDCDSYIA